MAKEEYEYIPASQYYRDGYNLYIRMEKHPENHLLFLHDLRVPANNNLAERTLRNYKRKQKQAVTFSLASPIHPFKQASLYSEDKFKQHTIVVSNSVVMKITS